MRNDNKTTNNSDHDEQKTEKRFENYRHNSGGDFGIDVCLALCVPRQSDEHRKEGGQ